MPLRATLHYLFVHKIDQSISYRVYINFSYINNKVTESKIKKILTNINFDGLANES